MTTGKLSLFLLGSPQIQIEGQTVSPPDRKSLALLAYLAQEGVQTRDTLATLLWPESDQKRARTNLRYILWSIRKTLGDEWLETRRQSIGLTSHVWTDVAEFYRCLSAHSKLDEAAQLYRDDFLQGFAVAGSPAFDEWQFFQTEALRRDLGGMLVDLISTYSDEGENEIAIELAQRRLSLDPFREDAQRMLMELYARAGQRSAALRQYSVCVDLLTEELGVEPEPATTQLFDQISHHQFPPDTHHSTSDESSRSVEGGHTYLLPGGLPILVGREKELALLAAQLADPTIRLLTIVGPGGIGKSSLAIWAVRKQITSFEHGISAAFLADTPTSAQAPSTVLRSLGLDSQPGLSPHVQLANFLENKELLLVLDNYDHLLPDANWIVELLQGCPRLTILVTSRERLSLSTEWLLPLDGLTYPELSDSSPAEKIVEEYGAPALFSIAAQRSRPSFRVDPGNSSFVVRICQLVDGLPLAVEMAAAWVRVLPVSTIANEIETNLELLISTARDMPERHQSIQAVFDHSWQMLSDGERSRLCSLTVFQGGFTGDAASDVAGATVFHLLRLVDTSWIRVSESGRYSMHKLAHQYAGKILKGANKESTGDSLRLVLLRHCQYFAGLMPKDWDVDKTLAILADEADNIRLAWQTSIDQELWLEMDRLVPAIPLLPILWWSPAELDRLDGIIATLEIGGQAEPGALATADRRMFASLEANMRHAIGEIRNQLGQPDEALPQLHRSRELFQELFEDSPEIRLQHALIARQLGGVYYNKGNYATAARYYDEALQIKGYADFRGRGMHQLVATLYDRLGRFSEAEKYAKMELGSLTAAGVVHEHVQRLLLRVLTHQGRYAEARDVQVQAVEQSQLHNYGHFLRFLGVLTRVEGNAADALPMFEQSVGIAQDAEDRPGESDAWLELGNTYLALDKYQDAQVSFEKSIVIARDIGRGRTVAVVQTGLGRVAVADSGLDLARSYLREAVTSSWEMGALPDLMDALVGVAELALAEGRAELAIRLLNLVETHTTATHETQQGAQRLITTFDFNSFDSNAEMRVETIPVDLDAIVAFVERFLKGSE